MTSITLNTAQTSNSGARIEAGTAVPVGIGPTEISEPRAKRMLACGIATEQAEAPKPAPSRSGKKTG